MSALTDSSKPGTFNRGRNNGTFTCDQCGTRRQRANLGHDGGPGSVLCVDCWERAGDENMVADGNMTCAAFLARYGAHSDYCDCAAVPVIPSGVM